MSSFHLTGRHVAAIFIGFFSVVIAVNILMTSRAVASFGGTVVDNSYVASQQFNHWLAKARTQRTLGWRQDTRLDADRHLVLTLSGPTDATVSAIARHPLGRTDDIVLRFIRLPDGRYRAITPLPSGRWIVHLAGRAKGQEMRFVERLG